MEGQGISRATLSHYLTTFKLESDFLSSKRVSMDKLKKITTNKLLSSLLRYLTGFLIGLPGAIILYIESPAFLTCNYVDECRTRECPINCILEKRWGGLITNHKETIQDFRGLSQKTTYIEALKSGEKDQYSYNLVIKHGRGKTELTPPAGDFYHYPTRDAVSKKATDFTNTGPTGEVLEIWQLNWLMMLIGYSFVSIWPLQLLNIILTVKKKFLKNPNFR